MNLQNLVDEVLTKIFSLAESCLGDLFKNKKGVNFTVSIELVFLSFSSSSSTEISTLPPPLPPTTTTMQLAEERSEKKVEGSVTNSSCHFMCILLHVTCMLVLVLSILVLAVGLVIGICIH